MKKKKKKKKKKDIFYIFQNVHVIYNTLEMIPANNRGIF